MFSNELYIMDKNLERLMVEEAREEARILTAERDIFKLRCKNKSPEEIAIELNLLPEYVKDVLKKL